METHIGLYLVTGNYFDCYGFPPPKTITNYIIKKDGKSDLLKNDSGKKHGAFFCLYDTYSTKNRDETLNQLFRLQILRNNDID